MSTVRNGFTRGHDLLRMSAGGEQRGFMIDVAAAEELIARTQQVKRSLESSPNGAISTADELVKWAQLRDQRCDDR